MQTRKGKHGEFFYCPNGNHGTIGVTKYRELMDHFTATHKAGTDIGYSGADPLMTAIEIQTMALGGGILPETERFFLDIDVDEHPYYESWRDIRPY